jgi:hypothetical protein
MPFVVDNSMLSSFFTCTMKGWTRYHLGLTTRDERAELLSGQAGHAALATYHLDGDKEGALRAFDGIYKMWGSQNVDPNDRLAWHNCRQVLDTFLTNHPPGSRAWPYVVDKRFVEVPFEVPLDDHGDFILVGRIDLIATYNSHFVVNENKFTGRIDDTWKRKFRLDSQLSSYFYACKYGLVDGQQLSLPIMGGFVTAIQLSKLPSDPSRKCREHGVAYAECGALHTKWEIFGPLPREEALLHGWRADALAGARRMKELWDMAPTIEAAPSIAQEGLFTGACRWCELQEQCLTGRDPRRMLAGLIYKPWTPLERGKTVSSSA